MAKEAAVEEGAIDLGVFDLSDHVDEHGIHLLLGKGGMEKRRGHLALFTKQGNFSLKRLIDPQLADLNEVEDLDILWNPKKDGIMEEKGKEAAQEILVCW